MFHCAHVHLDILVIHSSHVNKNLPHLLLEPIHAYLPLVDPILSVGKLTIKEYAHAYLTILEVLQAVDQSVLSIQNVPQKWLV